MPKWIPFVCLFCGKQCYRTTLAQSGHSPDCVYNKLHRKQIQTNYREVTTNGKNEIPTTF